MTPDDARRPAPVPDWRVRVASPLFRLIGPLVRRMIRADLAAGPNVLLSVRGRRTGQLRSTPLAMLELGDRRFLQASFGDVQWVRNLRVAGEGIITRGTEAHRYLAVELAPDVAGPLLRDALAPFRRSALVGRLLGPSVRPPAAILLRYHFRIDDSLEEYVAEARRHPLFELVEPG